MIWKACGGPATALIQTATAQPDVRRTPTSLTMRPFLAALILALSIGARADAQRSTNASSAAPEIVSAGSGEVRVKPDRATVTIAVITSAASAAEAGRLNTERLLPLLESLRRQGIPDSAVVTVGYSVAIEHPAYGEAPRPPGTPPTYGARNAVRVSLSNIDALGTVVDSALAAGASEISSIAFSSTEEPEARRRAIELAIQGARADAEVAAVAAGGRLGRLIELQVAPDPYDRLAMRLMEQSGYPGAAAAPISPRDLLVVATAAMRFEFIARP